MAIRMAEAGAMLHEDRLGKMWLLSLEKKKALAQPKSRRAAFFYPEEVVRNMDPGSSQCGMAKGWETTSIS